ncbi:MAG TPA: flagellar hook-associated protein 3 [Candidatus Latescibacteria bacterium]|nr:flagellar hook-associated protein 3 [Gemmatimonadota bacterium]HCR16778.1 flagellar hook-associated protein 3 [Candidatus Latescibacterota bacterium]
MRISDSVITNTVRNNVRRSVARLNEYQKALSSGVRINDASDDPTQATRSLLLRSDIRNGEQYQRNIEEGLGFMNFVDSTLDDMVNTLIGVRGTAIQGASDTVNADDREILARGVNELIEHMISRGQSKFRGRYIFAGTETLESPYTAIRNSDGDVVDVGNTLRRSIGLDDTTTAVGTLLGQTAPPAGTVTIGDQTVAIDLATDSLDDIKANIEAAALTGITVDIEESSSGGVSVYRLRINGTTTAVDDGNVLGTLGIGNVETTGSILREVGAGVHIQVNVEGRDLFEGAQNAFSGMINLRDSLLTNDIDGIRQSITDLESVREKISDARGVLGARTRRVELTRELLERLEVNLTSALGDAEDTDVTQTIIDLQSEQQVFQAALATGGSVFQPTLLDFLR